MKRLATLFVSFGILISLHSLTAAIIGDFSDHFDQPTLNPAWQEIKITDGDYPTGWSVTNGILCCRWSEHAGQDQLTVQTSTDRFTIQARCCLTYAGSSSGISSAILVLKETPPGADPAAPAGKLCGLCLGNGTIVFCRASGMVWESPLFILQRADLKLNTWHTLKAEINGSHIRCFLDDEMVFETDQPGYTGNYYGLTPLRKANVEFDDFQIRLLDRPAATSRAVGTGQFIDTGWPAGTGSQETVTFMIVVDPASTNPTNPVPANATVAVDSPSIRKLFGNSLVLQGTPEKYVENDLFTQDPKLPKEIHFKTADKLIMVGFNDNSLPGNNPDPAWADWVFLTVTNATTGNPLLVISGPLTSGDVMDYVPMTTQPVAPTLSVSTVMRVSWPYTLAQYTLEGADMANGPWQPVNSCVIDQAGEHQVFLPMTSPMKFFRVVESK